MQTGADEAAQARGYHRSAAGGPAATGVGGTSSSTRSAPTGRPSGERKDGRGSYDSGRSAGSPARSAPARGGASREEIAQRAYDPRREERRKATRVALPDDVDPRMLDADARRELRTLSKDTADLTARHLVMAGRLLDDDPEQALAHARAARALAGRVGVVREAAGLAAYAAGEWAEALSELRAARRITGRPEHLGVFADCERALGRPERALAYGDDPQLVQLSQDQRVELVIVLAGARRDLGQADAAVLTLQDPARRTTEKRPWAARLWYAYADALLEAGRTDQAQEWFAKAAAVDVDGETDAGDRLLELDGVVMEPVAEDDLEDRDGLPDDAELAELAGSIRVVPFAPEPAGADAPAGGDGEHRSPAEGQTADDAGATAVPELDGPGAASSGVPQAAFVPEADLEAEAVASPPPLGGVAVPSFVAPPGEPDEDGDLRLFE